MKLTFLGANETVTGSKYLIETNQHKILVDCGLFQGYKELRLRNWNPLPIEPADIHSVLLTHAHIDHSGYIPLLVKNGFYGDIFCTKATKDLCSILLPDSGYLHEEDAKRANKYHYSKHKKALPLYTQKQAEKSLKYFKTIEYAKNYDIIDNLQASWHRAGHILGSSFIKCEYEGTSILFSGDLGRTSNPVIKSRVNPLDVDYLVLESTYGDREHEQSSPEDILQKIIVDTAKRGGTVLIPSFAVGRAQMLLYYIYNLKHKNLIPDLPVYLDSPMAIKATDILQNNTNEHNLPHELCDKICDMAIITPSCEDSKAIYDNKMPKVIISASGMATGGRVLHHLSYYAPSHRNTILFAGFQAAGTRGDRILRGEKEVKIHGSMVPINAHVEYLSNTSAHADYHEILSWLEGLTNPPKHIFITHGEKDAAYSLQEKIQDKFGYSCSVPQYLDSEQL